MVAQFPDVVVDLSAQDTNVFGTIGEVAAALTRAGYASAASQYTRNAVMCADYGEVMLLTLATVSVAGEGPGVASPYRACPCPTHEDEPTPAQLAAG
ncbi:hypothetical protein QQG74_09325 [Micromonospora sp. FIMYZ51]|uniref:hypothetical protein n=1 Tax=Micromonospora sp. FIMYZ51 TaxID=3051832 RepID=UPI00311EC0C0